MAEFGVAEELVVGGSTPSERPAGAPTVRRGAKDVSILERGLTGVSKPYPASLLFLKDQGGWYSPFLHPGMHHPYDLRQWHGGADRGTDRGTDGGTSKEKNLKKEELPGRDRK